VADEVGAEGEAAAVLQCCVYSAEQLAAIQGADPQHLTLIPATAPEEELRFKDYGA